MENFRDFEGKQIDACINEAIAYFNCPREKLEIEIVQDAKSGIFGIVGARKAKIRARRLEAPENILNFLENSEEKAVVKNKNPRQERFLKSKQAPHEKQGKIIAKKQHISKKARFNNPEQPMQKLQNDVSQFINDRDEYPGESLEKLDPQEVSRLTCETVARLLQPIAGKEVDLSAEVAHGRVRVNVQWEGDAGLLIGREGQTLASLQYIASRILSQKMDAGVRVQLEIGDYKSRQDEKIKERAHFLAEKARQTGKSWSTQPLSSYHRRIIHMELQNEPGIITRSFGDGIMKKVVITPKHAG